MKTPMVPSQEFLISEDWVDLKTCASGNLPVNLTLLLWGPHWRTTDLDPHLNAFHTGRRFPELCHLGAQGGLENSKLGLLI